ncbi:MAG TPA: hypothetical protein VHG93_09725 [Longimicrobium sp.]|nr:hypothetical protein [Longimicrobium sp.]
MAEISHLTHTNAKEFSKQKMGDVLLPDAPGFDLRVGNLKLHCQQALGLLVPDSAIEAGNTFLAFMGAITVPAEKRLLALFHCISEKLGPGGIPTTPNDAFAALSLSKAFGAGAFGSNAALRALDAALRESVSPAFYSDPAAISDPQRSVKDAMRKILA